MNITLDRKAALAALTRAKDVTRSNGVLPILQCVLIAAEGDAARIVATDMEAYLTTTLPATVAKPGAVAIELRPLVAAVRTMTGASLTIKTGAETGVEVGDGESSITLLAWEAQDFPTYARPNFSHQFDISAPDLARLFERGAFAISTEETRYYLNGTYLHAPGNELRAVTTDGHRLAQIGMPAPAGTKKMPGVIVPRLAVRVLNGMLARADKGGGFLNQPGRVYISVSETGAAFALGVIELATKLIDGTFPEYERVIPQVAANTMEIDVKQFTGAIKKLAAVEPRNTRLPIKLELAADASTVRLSVSTPEGASSAIVLPTSYAGAAMAVGFQARYLLDVLGAMAGDTIMLNTKAGQSPTRITDSGDPEVLYVLMPVRV